MTLTLRQITEATELQALEPAWQELWAHIPDATPFQHPAWLLPWWRHLPKGALLALTAEREGRLLGLLPLCRIEERDGPALRPLGFDVSDYAEPLIAPDRAGEVATALFRALAKLPDWRRCGLVLREDASVTRCLPHGDACQKPLEPAPALDLDGVAARGLPSAMQRSLAEAHRRLRRAGHPVASERASAGTIGAILHRLFELHGRRWRQRGEAGVLDHPAVQAFHREAAARLHAAGLLRLTSLRIGGFEAAVFYGMAAKAVTYFYIGGFDPDLRVFSPGSLVIAEEVERAIREHSRIFDFLRGREPYKYRWGAVDHGRCAYEFTPQKESQDVMPRPPAGPGIARARRAVL
jgi:CelD/BcsL family acetyltransferase involved in cellulose biosynthesis